MGILGWLAWLKDKFYCSYKLIFLPYISNFISVLFHSHCFINQTMSNILSKLNTNWGRLQKKMILLGWTSPKLQRHTLLPIITNYSVFSQQCKSDQETRRKLFCTWQNSKRVLLCTSLGLTFLLGRWALGLH